MQAKRGNHVCRLEFPFRKRTHHDFKAVRHPLDAFGKGFEVSIVRRRLAQLEYDLRLDARLHRAVQALKSPVALRVTHSRVVDGCPERIADRLRDAVFGTFDTAGKPDLPPDRLFAMNHAL